MQVLCIQGFLACRKHADRIILLVEMMQNSGCPCFKAGPRAVAALRKRFHLNLPESQVISQKNSRHFFARETETEPLLHLQVSAVIVMSSKPL
jgi:hypothetical protein